MENTHAIKSSKKARYKILYINELFSVIKQIIEWVKQVRDQVELDIRFVLI